MHKSEPTINPWTMPSWYMSSDQGALGPIGVLNPLESNFEIDSIGKIELLHSHTLDHVGYMKTILGFFKSIKMETYDYKNHLKIKI